MVEIKGREFDISFTDADTIERYEEAAREMREAVADKTRFKNLTASAAIREQCRVMAVFIDKTLNTNASDMIFNGKMDLLEHMTACEEINTRAAEARKAIADLSNKYTQKQQGMYKGNVPITAQNNMRNFHGGKNNKKGGSK